MTVEQVLDYYLREHVRVSVLDRARAHQVCANLTAGLGDKDVAKLDARALNAYSEARRAGTVGSKPARSDGTLRREMGTLVAAINFAVADRKLARADAPTVRLPARPAARDVWLDEEELSQLLAAAGEVKGESETGWRGWLFVTLASETAARRNAIETLTWAQVNMPAQLIDFNAPGRAQSKKRRPCVPISDRLYPALLEAFSRREIGCKWVIGSKSECVRAFRKVAARAHCRTDNEKFLRITPHSLRHTWGTQAARAGVDLFQISGVMGNSMNVCQQNYIHHAPAHLRGAVNFRRV